MRRSFLAKPVWFPAGDRGVLLDLTGYAAQLDGLPAGNERQVLTRTARQLGQLVAEKQNTAMFKGITDIVPGLSSLLVHYDPLITTAAKIKAGISVLLDKMDMHQQTQTRLWTLPVHYAEQSGPDIEEVAEHCQISVEEVISLHCNTELEVGIMGFLPGLAYMTGLHPRLYLPRRSEPRTKVPGGTVAIAMDQTVIYPLDSPGGWNLIGAMPVPLFDARRPDPVLLKAGDKIAFRSVEWDEFTQIKAYCQEGEMPLIPEYTDGQG